MAVLDYTSPGRTGFIAAETEKQMKGKKKKKNLPTNQGRKVETGKMANTCNLPPASCDLNRNKKKERSKFVFHKKMTHGERKELN